MSDKPENPAAFPVTPGEIRADDGRILERTECGMTLRDYFAAKALQGFLANAGGPIQNNGSTGWGLVNCNIKFIAEYSYDFADAMLKARVGQKGVAR